MVSSGLSEDELKRYRQHGVLAQLNGLKADVAQRTGQTIITIADELLEDGASIEALSFRPWEGDVHPFESPLSVLTENAAIRQAVRGILGGSVMLRGCEIFYKPGVGDLGNQKVPWHWDFPFVDNHEEHALTVWVALTETGPHNGGIEYIQGSHKAVVERGVADPKQRVLRGADLASFGDHDKEQVSMEPGQFSIHHACILHGSGQNEGPPRLGVAMRFFSTEAPTAMIGNKSGLPIIGTCDDGRYEPTNNYPIQWWDREQESVTRVMRSATRLSITDNKSKNIGRILSSNSSGLIEFVEEETRKGWEELEGEAAKSARINSDLEWGDGISYPLTQEGCERAIKADSMTVIDSDSGCLDAWSTRLGGWRFLNRHLVHVPEEESTEVFDVGAMSPPIVFRPRRPESREFAISLDEKPVSGFAADMGIWVAHHGDVMASHSHGCLIALPPLKSVQEMKGILGLLDQLFKEAQLPSLNWKVILNGSALGTIRGLAEMLESSAGRVAGVFYSEAEHASQLFRGQPSRRSLLMSAWNESSRFKALSRAALISLSDVIEGSELALWTEHPDDHEWKRFNPATLGSASQEDESSGRPSIDLEASIKKGLETLTLFQEGKCSVHTLEAHVSQHRHWVLTGVQLDSGARLDDRLFGRTLRDVASQRGDSPRNTTLWRQLVLGRGEAKEADTVYQLNPSHV